jgi:hypothetical protein
VSLKSRLRRLDAGVRWLETEGVFVRVQLAGKLQGMLQDMSDHAAAHPDVAAKWKSIRHLLPPPRVKVPPAAKAAPRVVPILRDAPPRGAPQDEVVRIQEPTKPHPEERPARPRLEGCEPVRPPPEPLPGQPAELPSPDMEIRPTRWRGRTAQDYYDEDERPGTNGRCITEYDPLRDEDDDDDG